MNDDIGEREWFAEDELFLHGLVARAFALEVDGPHGAIGPVVDVDGVLILRGEFRSGARDDASGAAGADVERLGDVLSEVEAGFYFSSAVTLMTAVSIDTDESFVPAGTRNGNAHW